MVCKTLDNGMSVDTSTGTVYKAEDKDNDEYTWGKLISFENKD